MLPVLLTLVFAAQDSWQPLEIPSLCESPPAHAPLRRLDGGSHLLLPSDEEPNRSRPATAPRLPLQQLVALLQDEGQRASAEFALHPQVPPLLGRGVPESLTTLLADLDQAGQAMRIELDAWLTPGSPEQTCFPAAAQAEAAVGSTSPLGSTTVRSGQWVTLGARTHQSFLANYRVQVATDSGVAAPIVGQALLGETLHLRACRVRAGAAVHLQGFLDVASLVEMNTFATDTGGDLGSLQQPVVRTLQVSFSGTIESGGYLACHLTSSADGDTGQTLWLRARTTPDTAGASWRTREVAFLEQTVLPLPAASPGSGLAVDLPTNDGLALQEPLSSAALAQAADESLRRSGNNRGRAPLVWAPGVVLAPTQESDLWREIDDLIDAAERARLSSVEVRVEADDFTCRVPASDGMPTRILVGRETTRLGEYDIDIAPESWMPVPRVSKHFDGTLLEGHARHGALRFRAWTAATTNPTILQRDDLGVGALQLADRHFQSARAEVRVGEETRTILNARANLGAVRVQVLNP